MRLYWGKIQFMDNEQSSKDLEELENLKMGYAALHEDYKIQIERLKTADEKSNMLLVFNAAIVALLILVFPLNETSKAIFVLSIITLALFISSMMLTLIMIIVAIFHKVVEHKFLCQKVAMIATLVNIVFIATLIFLNII